MLLFRELKPKTQLVKHTLQFSHYKPWNSVIMTTLEYRLPYDAISLLMTGVNPLSTFKYEFLFDPLSMPVSQQGLASFLMPLISLSFSYCSQGQYPGHHKC